jgi:DNA processing protein
MQIKEILVYFAIKYQGDWEKILHALRNYERVDDKEVKATLSQIKSKYTTIVDEDFPPSLKDCMKPPFVIFYYGDLSLANNLSNCLGVVGSREASVYGLNACEKVISELKESSIVIVSGLAHGIDAMAHQSALQNNLKTIAILGTGIDYCYPKSNLDLYHTIKEKGLVLSEYPGTCCVGKTTFAFRNRLIASLSKMLLIPEAHVKSGTFVTIRFALDLGKDILVIPHPIFANQVNNMLIQEGAKLVATGKDILDEMK